MPRESAATVCLFEAPTVCLYVVFLGRAGVLADSILNLIVLGISKFFSPGFRSCCGYFLIIADMVRGDQCSKIPLKSPIEI